MRFKGLIAIGTAMLLTTSVFSASAQTDGGGSEGLVTLDLTGITGTRSVTLVEALAPTGVLSGLPTDDYAVTVAEVARTGTNPWSVTGRVCGPDNAAVPTASDCTNHGDELVLAADDTTTFGGANMSVSGRGVSELVPGGSGTLTAPGTTDDLSAARTLFTNTGQSTSLTYTETYTGTGTVDITPPDGTTTGVYAGYFVVTLVQ